MSAPAKVVQDGAAESASLENPVRGVSKGADASLDQPAPLGYAAALLRHHRTSGPPVGAYHPVEPTLAMGHDATTALIIPQLRALNWRPKHPERLLFAADHFAPPASTERANILALFLAFCREIGAEARLFDGICHQLLAEDPRVGPGALVIGADSHTVMPGALGCFATGAGSTDFLALLVTGAIYLREPEPFFIRLHGRWPPFADGKEAVLALLERFGPDTLTGRSLEYRDDTPNGVSMDTRLGICNMAVELGAKTGLFYPDAVTQMFLDARDGPGRWDLRPWQALVPAAPAHFELDVGRLEPRLAEPPGLNAIAPVRTRAGTPVNQVFIGSCSSARIEDLALAARILKGRRVAKGVRCLVIPASQAVYRLAVANGIVGTLMDAGCVVMNSSCGPCGGIDKGLAADGDVVVSTSNRNFRGRMGSFAASIFLAGAATAAATAVAGQITDPREFLV